MRITVTDFHRDVRISVEPENAAELYQLQAIKEQLDGAMANWQAWNNMEGRKGIVIVGEKRSVGRMPGMDIRAATQRAIAEDLWICKRDRTSEFRLFVAPGAIYRKESGEQVDLDARDCVGDDWYLIDVNGNEIT